ncbi:hypothetical protein [Mariniblastus fucicola]|nr:hypothetical protein [Mariniblastus fucicola]
MSNYTAIDPEKIISTIERLKARIEERFPKSGLRNVCDQLHEVSVHMKERSNWIARPVHWLRILTWVVCILIVVGTVGAIWMIGSDASIEQQSTSFSDFVTLLEAGINDVVLIGAAIFFLLSFETRYKRSRALKALHELRSIAHVIDMHQLTKDPHRITQQGNSVFVPGLMSPKLNMTPFELRRYLDYCSEMLSLTGKVAAVYNQAFDDGVATAAASELESLTTGLSSKIWQKILILESSGDSGTTPRIETEV